MVIDSPLYAVIVLLVIALVATVTAFACYYRARRRIDISRTGEASGGIRGSRPPRRKPPPVPRSLQPPSSSPFHSASEHPLGASANSGQENRHLKSASKRHNLHGRSADCHALGVWSETQEQPQGLHSDSEPLSLGSPGIEAQCPYLDKSSPNLKASLAETKQSSRNRCLSDLRSEHSSESSTIMKSNKEIKFRKDNSAAGKIQIKSAFSLELALKMEARSLTSKPPSSKNVIEQRRSFSDQEPDYVSLGEDSEDNCGSNSATLQRPLGGRTVEQQQLYGVQYMNVIEVSGPYMNVITTNSLAKGRTPELHKAVSDPEHLYESLGEDEQEEGRSGNATWQGMIGPQTLRRMRVRTREDWRSMERDSHPYANPCSTDDEDPYEEIRENM
ncbi:uncharacterized protein LOC125039677 [Penaeus chinensis]|uniref:uncharacterized protein LOC125039677 n=1 Tax=Penaeus chinensis TaxID=139456 RepID=UPI001FB61930|nr:uncharacterized protein LOC125039677 [Penaeus chinensis]